MKVVLVLWIVAVEMDYVYGSKYEFVLMSAFGKCL